MSPRQTKISRLVTQAADREQRKIAEDLHDSVSQTFSGLGLLVRVLAHKLQRWGPEAVEETKALADLTHRAVDELHEHVQWSQVQDFEDATLAHALQALARATSRRMPCGVECDSNPIRMPAETSFQLYHIAREAVRNAVHHARAKKITIGWKSGATALLTVSDDGCGFDPKASRSARCSGLDMIRCRARLIGASVRVKSRPGQGTSVSCRL